MEDNNEDSLTDDDIMSQDEEESFSSCWSRSSEKGVFLKLHEPKEKRL